MSAAAPPVPLLSATDPGAQESSNEGLPQISRFSSSSTRSSHCENAPSHKTRGLLGDIVARRTLGIILLLIVVVLWTASNFLASTILADNTYSKPYFVTYLNTSFFILPLIPIVGQNVYRQWRAGRLPPLRSLMASIWRPNSTTPSEEHHAFLKPDDEQDSVQGRDTRSPSSSQKLDFQQTAKLSFEFCILWFLANYFAMACLQYTTVASTTILTSTSSIWTLLFGALLRVEAFTLRKLLGVLFSLFGILLISRVDLSGSSDDNRGSFPHKSRGELAVGDAMAFFSAILYGVYTVVMKKRIGSETRVSMPLFFGLVGLFNVLLLWPGFVVLHFAGVERWGLPQTDRVWIIILLNSVTSLLSDICWAYAMLLTSPLVVTVGLSLTIPLSLVGQIIIDSQYSSFAYWIGAGIVFLSFIYINRESREEGIGEEGDREGGEYGVLGAEERNLDRGVDSHLAISN